jgi:hypothetical protein
MKRFILLIILLSCPNALALSQTLPDTKDGDYQVNLDDLRRSMARDFAGQSGFDDAMELTIGDQLQEITVQQQCRSVAEVLRAVRDIMPQVELSQVGASRQFPRNGLSFVRKYPVSAGKKDGPTAKDIVLLYFDVHKGQGLQCTFTFGAFARTTMKKGPDDDEKKRDELYNKLISDIGASILEIEKALAKPREGSLFRRPGERPPPIDRADEILNALRSSAIRDDIRDKSLSIAKDAIQQALTLYSSNTDFEVIATDFRKISDLAVEPYYTPNCIAVPYDFRTPLIICNTEFLSEMEVVLRYYEHGENLQTTKAITGLIAMLDNDPTAILRKVRADPKLMKLSGEDNDHITDHMSMLLLFLLSHEVGHLMSGADLATQDESALNKSKDYEASILRLCKQADQFAAHDFHLDGFEAIVEPSSAVRAFVTKFRERDRFIDLTDQKFREEEVADELSGDLTLSYFKLLSKSDRQRSDYLLYLYVENMQSIAIYTWYKSFTMFQQRTCGELRNTESLGTCLGFDPEKFISAADVFGKYHSHVFVRTFSMMSVLIAERTSFYDIPLHDRVVAVTAGELAPYNEQKRRHVSEVLGIVQRFLFMKELVDTPLKLAFTGCMMAWVNEVRSSPPAFLHGILLI